LKKSAECMRSHRVSSQCDKCGVRPEVLHLPTKRKGFFCPDCCSVCNESGKADVIENKGDGTPKLHQVSPKTMAHNFAN
jgi:hypothetical protein